jgi:hypothetical protein
MRIKHVIASVMYNENIDKFSKEGLLDCLVDRLLTKLLSIGLSGVVSF